MDLSQKELKEMDNAINLSDNEIADMDDAVGYDNIYDNLKAQQQEVLDTADNALQTGQEALDIADNALKTPMLQGEVSKTIDYTKNPVTNFLLGIGQGAYKLPLKFTKNIANFTHDKFGWGSDEELNKLNQEGALGFYDTKPKYKAGKTGAFIGEIAPMFGLPELTVFKGTTMAPTLGNLALTGGYQAGLIGGLNQLADDGKINPVLLGGETAGGALGGSLMKLTPWATKNITAGFVGVKPETLAQAVKPTSKALDLTDEAADKLALDTTERFRNAYDTLKAQKGQVVQDMADKLTNLNKPLFQTPVATLKKYVSDIYDAAQVGRSNKLRRLAPKAEKIVNEEINAIEPNMKGVISPSELESLKQTLGGKIDWTKTDLDTQNQILEQVYGKMNNRLNALSPDLANANKEYANLFDMLGNKSRLKTILSPNVDIETAVTKMKNYKATNDNIFDLEKQLVNELKEQPFLNAIDDVNAAKNLNESLQTGRNFLGIPKITKDILLKPTLFTIRKLNTTPIPKVLGTGYNNIQNNLAKYLLGGYEASKE